VIVAEVVAALTGDTETQRGDLRAQMERAARDFDAHTAESFCKALLAYLGEDPTAVRELEALLILGLAHPNLLAQHRIQLVQEGRRLAVLLEKNGEVERAQTLLEVLANHSPQDRGVERELSGIMRRSGSLDRLIERHLRRAEEAIREGRREEAVHWLREVLVLDRSRRDVARMIRDLRYEDTERRSTWRRRLQIAALVTVLTGAAFAIAWREQRIESEYAQLPIAAPNDYAGMKAQLAVLDEWISKNPLWIGMFDASGERARLRTDIEKIDSARHAEERIAAATRAKQETAAEAERVLGRKAAEQNDFAAAFEHFQRALQAAPTDWAPRQQVQTDLQAIAAWQQRTQVSQREQKR
jgi:tetratricopeptide (TPR) repeat protein